MLPAKKKRITARGSRSPAALTVLNTLARVFRQGRSMKPRNRYAKKAKPKTFARSLGLRRWERVALMGHTSY